MTAGPNPAPLADAPLTITTLGGANLARANEILLLPGKPLALITYLALTPGHTASREFLLDLLWADLDRDRGRHALRQTLWQLRQLLGDTAIKGREELALSVAIDADRDHFLAAIESQDLEAAVARYRGGFLPDFALPGSHEFEHWAEIERSRLRSTFLRAAEMVTRRRLASGRFREAQELARRMRDADRLNETGWRLLLESLSAARDHLQATLEADALVGTLTAEGREPEPATKALLAEIGRLHGGAAAPDDHRPSGLVAELMGREREFALLLEAWAQASKGPARHLHLSAPAGHGKTRLLADLAHRLRSLGARVVYLRANPGDRNVLYAFAGDLALALGPLPGLPAISPEAAGTLVGLSPSLSARFPNAKENRNPSELLRLRTAALTEAVTEIAAERAMALLIDDAHWLDPHSHQVLEGVLHRLDRSPVLVVTAGRPALNRPLEVAGTTLLELEPLSATAIRGLVTSLGRMTDAGLLDPLIERLEQSTAGSPLLVIETLQLALERGHLKLQDGTWTAPDAESLLRETSEASALSARLAALEGEAAWILLLLATAGTPLSTGELGSATRAKERLDEHLWVLERKGLIHRVGESWEPAHDEIAGAALEGETPDRRRSAHVAVGRILLGSTSRVDLAIEACRHFARGADRHALQAGFHRLVRLAREVRDPRRQDALAFDCTAGIEAAPSTRSLIAALPLRVRFGLDTRIGAIAAAVVVLLGAALVAEGFRRGATAPDGSLLLVRTVDSATAETAELSIYRGRWSGGTPLRPERWRRVRDSQLAQAGTLAVHPDGRTWAFTSFVDNERTDDVFVRSGGKTELLTGGGRDDAIWGWAPSGKALYFLTARWSGPGNDEYDIGAMDWETRQVRRFTSTLDYDHDIYPAPHGALIAFTRSYRELRPRQVCWMTADGGAGRCLNSTIGEVSSILGWLDARRILVNTMLDPTDRLVEWDLLTGEFRMVEGGIGGPGWVSPDGQWVVCNCHPDLRSNRRWIVFPSNQPTSYRTVPSADSSRLIAWMPTGPNQPPVKVRIGRPLQVPAGERYSPTAEATVGAETPLPLPEGALRWSVSDTSVATIDSTTGRITARRAGLVSITVELAGMAADTAPLRVVDHRVSTSIEERWERIDSTRWILLGTPFPRIERGPGGIDGLNNNGDGSYLSGVVSSSLFQPAAGLGLRARVSLPVNRSQWQTQILALASDRLMPLVGWDRRTGSPRIDRGVDQQQCAFTYPAGEGGSGARAVWLGGGTAQLRVAVDSTWRLGAWHTVEIQIFPDGTCAFRIDGAPVWRTDSKVPLDQLYRVHLTGNSAGTTMLVGPVEVWEGVRRDLEWTPATPNNAANHPER